jgi:RNA polymerase sigma-70 factor (ECF subfamily)
VNSQGRPDRRAASDHEPDFDRLLEQAKGGCLVALGQIVELCRPYLLLIANKDLSPQVRGKTDASDVVQETLIAVQKDIAQFRGRDEGDFLAWVRGILINDLMETRRRHCHTAKRDVGREVPLDGDSVAGRPAIEIVGQGISPSSEAIAKEEADALAWAMCQIPDHYREVIQLRNWEELSFEEIGTRIGRSAEATRKLWSRAVLQLQQVLERSAFRKPAHDADAGQC